MLHRQVQREVFLCLLPNAANGLHVKEFLCRRSCLRFLAVQQRNRNGPFSRINTEDLDPSNPPLLNKCQL